MKKNRFWISQGLMPFGHNWILFSIFPYYDKELRADLTPYPLLDVLPAPYFIATKIESFYHRGAGDFLLSKDVEDVIAVIDGRLELVGDVSSAQPNLIQYIAKQLTNWLENSHFLDALPGLIPPDSESQARVPSIIKRIEKMVKKEQ